MAKLIRNRQRQLSWVVPLPFYSIGRMLERPRDGARFQYRLLRPEAY